MGELPDLPLLLFQLLLEVMLVLADMLPTQLVLFTLPSVKLKLNQKLRLMLDFSMEDTDMVSDSDMLVLDMPDMVDMDLVIPVLDTDTVLDTTARDPLMLNQRPRPMLDFSMEDMDMVLDLDMPDMVVMDSDIPVLDTDTVLDTMARDPLMLNQRLRPMLDLFMEDTDMVLVLAMLVLAMPVLVMVMVDMVLDTEVSTMVKKQHLKAHKSSKAICYSVPNYWVGIVI